MIAALSILPSPAELASMWPMWLVLLAGCIVWLYAWHQEDRGWREYQHRMRRREMADRIKARQNSLN